MDGRFVRHGTVPKPFETVALSNLSDALLPVRLVPICFVNLGKRAGGGAVSADEHAVVVRVSTC